MTFCIRVACTVKIFVDRPVIFILDRDVGFIVLRLGHNLNQASKKMREKADRDMIVTN
jgi:hypothetical protein